MRTKPEPTTAPSRRLSGRRRGLIWALVVLASLIALGSILITWVHRQKLDEQAWREASAELIQNERVREALSVYLVNELYADVDVSAALAGVITVMRSDQLSAAQTAVQAVRVLSALLLVLVLALYALAIYLARGARRETWRNIGWAVVVVGLLVLVVRRVGGNVAIEALTTPSSRDAGRQVWLISTALLGQIGWVVILYGTIALLGALLAGPSRPAMAVRRRVASVLKDQPGVAWAIVGVVSLLAIIWGGTHALRTLWGVALLGALLAAGVLALRRRTLREAADGGLVEA